MTTVAAPRWHGASSVEELDLLDYSGLAHSFAVRYAARLGYADALQEAWVALCEARDKWDPRRGPFQGFVKLVVCAHFSNLIEKDDRRRGRPVYERKSGKQRMKRGHVYERRPADEVRLTLVSTSQVDDDGKPIDIYEVIADETTPSPERVLLDAERARLVEEILAGVSPQDRERAERILSGEVSVARGRLMDPLARERLARALAGVEGW